MTDVKLMLGNCLDRLKDLDDNSVDSIVTDPPYGIDFMGKKWDYDVPSTEIWEQAMRVLKPGGYLLAFAGTRTQHRMAVRIEDAGFEIRDMIAWVYGSGFPKSHNVSKAIDKHSEKPETNEKIIELKTQLIEMFDQCGLTKKKIDEKCGFRASNYLTLPSETKKYDPWVNILPSHDKWKIIKEVIGAKDDLDIDALYNDIEREVIGTQTKARSTSGKSALPTVGGDVIYETWEITASATDAAKQWEGWGTALKPALEPITVARKPLEEKTVAKNVLKYGTGGINIDASRVHINPDDANFRPNAANHNHIRHTGDADGNIIGTEDDDGNSIFLGQIAGSTQDDGYHNTKGRFPANLIHDGSEEVTELFPDTKSRSNKSGSSASNNREVYGKYTGELECGASANHDPIGIEASAARFFYVPKTSKKDRNDGLENFTPKATASSEFRPNHAEKADKGEDGNPYGRWTPTQNNHPTVKPTDLMRYLVTMVTPKGGTTLDPFMGSGSTGRGAKLGGFNFIGIELDENYLEIAKARIDAISTEVTLEEFFT